jgi:hypothetical protein
MGKGLGLRVESLGKRTALRTSICIYLFKGLGRRVKGEEFRIYDLGFGVHDLEFRFYRLGFRV